MLYAIEEYMNLRCIGLAVVLIGVASTFAAWTSTALHYQFDEYTGFKGFKDKVLRVDFGRTDEISHDWGHHGRILMISILMAIISSAAGLFFQKSVLSLRLFNNRKMSQKIPPRYFGFVAGLLSSLIGCILFTITLSEGSWGVGHAHYGELLTEPSCEELNANFVSMYRKREHEEPKPKKYWRYLRNKTVMDPMSPNYDEQYVEYPSKYACRDWQFHLTFFLLKTMCVLISVSVGGPGGIFFPALLLGGSLGSSVAGIFSALDPFYAEQYRILPVLAMVGLFSSLMRTPMTAILVTYEMSGYGIIGLKPGLTFYMIIVSALSYLICEQVQHVDLVMCVMAQDGIDFKHLFYHGLKVEEEKEDEDAEGGPKQPKAKSASFLILMEAANRADFEQTLADNVWMHRLAHNYNVKGIHDHLLRGARVDLNWINPRNGSTTMEICIENELQNAIRLILFKKSDPGGADPSKMPLILSCRKGLAEASQALMAYGADFNLPEQKLNEYPIHAAAMSGSHDLVLALIQANSSLSVTNSAGETPLLIAARNRHQHLVTILTAEAWRLKSESSRRKRKEEEILGVDDSTLMSTRESGREKSRSRSQSAHKSSVPASSRRLSSRRHGGLHISSRDVDQLVSGKQNSETGIIGGRKGSLASLANLTDTASFNAVRRTSVNPGISGSAATDLMNDSDEEASDTCSDSSFWSRISGIGEGDDDEAIVQELYQSILNLRWFDNDILVAENFNRFSEEMTNNIDKNSLEALTNNFMTMKQLWSGYRNGSSVFQIGPNKITRHRSQLEIKILAKISTETNVLMENTDSQFNYIHYFNQSVYLNDDWDINFETALLLLFQFSAQWQNEHMNLFSHESCVETKREEIPGVKEGSGSLEFYTKDHLTLIVAEVIDPSAPGVCRAQIGLPVGEQFIRNGKRFKWVPELEAVDLIRKRSESHVVERKHQF